MNKLNHSLCNRVFVSTMILLSLISMVYPVQATAQGTDEGILLVAFEAKRVEGDSVQEALEKAVIPEFVGRIIWGFNVEIWDKDRRTMIREEVVPAVYVPAKLPNTYEMLSPQSFTMQGLVAGQTYHVRVFPLCVYSSPNLADKNGKRYTYGVMGSHIYYRYLNSNQWQPVCELPKDCDLNNPGYFLCHVVYWEGSIQATKRGKGQGNVHGTAW